MISKQRVQKKESIVNVSTVLLYCMFIPGMGPPYPGSVLCRYFPDMLDLAHDTRSEPYNLRELAPVFVGLGLYHAYILCDTPFSQRRRNNFRVETLGLKTSM